MDALRRLQDWYLANCNGDWEHSYGIEIGTLDNPGWSLKVDLAGTPCAGRVLMETSVGDSDTDASWCVCRVVENRYESFGGPLMLETMIGQFLEWATPN
jgi:hypothetical protein